MKGSRTRGTGPLGVGTPEVFSCPSLLLEPLCNLPLPGVFAVEGWIPLLQKGAETHRLRTLLVPLPTIQSTITKEEIRERSIDRITGFYGINYQHPEIKQIKKTIDLEFRNQ